MANVQPLCLGTKQILRVLLFRQTLCHLDPETQHSGET